MKKIGTSRCLAWSRQCPEYRPASDANALDMQLKIAKHVALWKLAQEMRRSGWTIEHRPWRGQEDVPFVRYEDGTLDEEVLDFDALLHFFGIRRLV